MRNNRHSFFSLPGTCGCLGGGGGGGFERQEALGTCVTTAERATQSSSCSGPNRSLKVLSSLHLPSHSLSSSDTICSLSPAFFPFSTFRDSAIRFLLLWNCCNSASVIYMTASFRGALNPALITRHHPLDGTQRGVHAATHSRRRDAAFIIWTVERMKTEPG